MATLQFIQAQKFVLSGSGTSIGDTTIILQSMVGIDAANIVTADLGTTAFGTLEPGNGTQEEAISFTGITQNANGTATLTGVKSCLFKSPYTATSGLAKTHAGASTFILSNDAAFYDNIMTYVNTSLSSGAVPATTSVNGISRLSVTPASAATPIVVGDNDPRIPTTGQAQAFAGTGGTPSSSNKYVTETGLASTFSTGSTAPLVNVYSTGVNIWVKQTGTKYIVVKVVGAGGGGGGNTTSGFTATGGGGGGYSEKRILAATLASSEVATVGTGGIGGVGTGGNGGTGGTSSFGSHCQATGGSGGTASAQGGNGGVGSSGDFNAIGQGGAGGATSNSFTGGSGGSSVLGGGAPTTVPDANPRTGNDGGVYGGGGGGAHSGDGSDTVGGAGAQGVVIVTTYYS
jgi:hypothetical protein